eukprot:8279325-Pyramimonas_sp.AAC.1
MDSGAARLALFSFGDDTCDDCLGLMTLPHIDRGIQQGLAAAEIPKFNLLGFDACLMAAYEVVAQ